MSIIGAWASYSIIIVIVISSSSSSIMMQPNVQTAVMLMTILWTLISSSQK